MTVKDRDPFTLPVKAFKVTNVVSGAIEADNATSMIEKLKNLSNPHVKLKDTTCFEESIEESVEGNVSAASKFIETREIGQIAFIEESIDSDESVEENVGAASKFIETREIAFNLLVHPNKDFKIRDIHPKHVDNLVLLLLAANENRLSSLLTVCDTNGTYEVIDGNHRLAAMTKIRNFHNPQWFKSVNAIIYKDLTQREAISIACGRNAELKKSLNMTDYEIVENMRKLFKGVLSHAERLEQCYEIFRATCVS